MGIERFKTTLRLLKCLNLSFGIDGTSNMKASTIPPARVRLFVSEDGGLEVGISSKITQRDLGC